MRIAETRKVFEMHVRSFAIIAAITACFSSSTVDADVLEIGDNGSTWVAGGPALTQESNSTGQSAPLSYAATFAGPQQWRPHVARIASKYDLSPQLLEALIWQESRWNPRAVSPAGARGLTQLMPGTARDLGVNPDDPLANLEGGARYLRQQLNAFGGDLQKALAAYNAGPGSVVRAGGVPNFRETKAYIAAIMGRLSQPVRR